VARPLSPPEISERLRAQLGDDLLAADDSFGHAAVRVAASRYHEAVQLCRDEPTLACAYCDFVGGVDRGDDGFEVVTALFSITHHHNVRITVPLPARDPAIDTISDLYPTANWHERELMEMFGIEVTGHPQPVKLLLPEPFEGHPLRKDFPLMSRVAKPWPGEAEAEDGEGEGGEA
jgi:NADH-quinone oxidoreductase subunit C